MSGTPFQIPGLGQTIPAENLTPDLLAAAAAIGVVDGLALGAIDNGTQVEKQQHQVTAASDSAQTIIVEQATQQDGPANKTQPAINTQPAAADAMELDKPSHIDEPIQDAESRENKPQSPAQQAKDSEDTDMAADNVAPLSPHVVHALEAALGGPINTTNETTGTAQDAIGTEGAEPTGVENQNQEWEVDSSPYESSSDESSSSDDDSDEEDGGYQLLGIEETARMLMSEIDNDGAGKDKGGDGFRLRTKNEVVEEVLPKPDVTITPETKLELLGVVQWVVEKTAVIKSNSAGEVQVLDIGTALCLGDRTIIGALAETIGNVKSPLYTVNFATEKEIKDLQLSAGTEIFYPVDHAKYVFTQTLKQEKGTDASNLHDEELGPDEMEFSDDEKEAEYKRQQKLKKRGNKAGRGGREQGNQGNQGNHPHPLSNSNVPGAPAGSALNYDEDEDGPYKPLPRPAGFGQGVPPSLPSLPPKPEGGFSQPAGGHGTGYGHTGGGHRGGRGDFRGGRGGNRGGRGNHGRGGRGDHRQYNDRRQGAQGNYGGYAGQASAPSNSPANSYQAPQTQQQPPQPPQNPHLPPPPYGANPPPIPPPQAAHWPAAPAGFVPPPPPVTWPQGQAAQHQPPAAPQFNFNYQAWAQSQHNAYGYGQQPQAPTQQPAAPAYPPTQGAQAPAYAPAPAPAWHGVPPPPPPNGAYVNPAFFGALQRQQPETRQGQIPPTPPQPVQQQHQQYWGQHQPHGGYGQGK